MISPIINGKYLMKAIKLFFIVFFNIYCNFIMPKENTEKKSSVKDNVSLNSNDKIFFE